MFPQILKKVSGLLNSLSFFYLKLVNFERKSPLLSFYLEMGLILLFLGYIGHLSLDLLPIAIQWWRIPSYILSQSAEGWEFGPFALGLLGTLKLSLLSLVLTLFLGYSTAMMRTSNLASARWIAYIYVEMIRTTPLLIQLYIAYFLWSPVLDINPFYTAVLALSLFEGAYTAEIIRSTIMGIPDGQYHAGMSLGLSQWQLRSLVIHPQALKKALPILANQGVSLIKDSALASSIGVFELSRSAQTIQERSFLPFEPWLGVCMIYFIITFILSLGVKKMEKKYSYGG